MLIYTSDTDFPTIFVSTFNLVGRIFEPLVMMENFILSQIKKIRFSYAHSAISKQS